MSALPDDERAPAFVSEAARLDAELPPTDWSVLPDGIDRGAIAAPSGSLACIAMGPADGQRVVLVPGVTGSKEDFILMMPLLAAAGYRAESFDMAGQYESYAAGPENLDPPQHRYTLELFTDDLVAVLRAGSTPAHVLGYSFAGTVASVVAVEHPELVASLTLLSAPPLPGQSLRGFKVLGRFSGPVSGRTAASLMIWGVSNNVHRGPKDRAAFIRARFALTRRSSVGDILGLMKQTPDVADAVRAGGVPTLVATGTGDVWPVSAHREFARRLGATLLVLDTGHSPCETAPHQLTEAMLQLFGH